MRINSAPQKVFQHKTVPPDSRLVGWAGIVNELSAPCPVREPCCISNSHVKGSRRATAEWRIFDRLEPAVIENYVRAAPLGLPNRIVWFLFEFLRETTLDLPDSQPLTAVDVLDRKRYFAGKATLSSGHRVQKICWVHHDSAP